MIPNLEDGEDDEDADAQTRSSSTGKFPQEGDTITGVMGGVKFTAVVVVCTCTDPALASLVLTLLWQESTSTTLIWTGPPLYHLFRGVHVFRFTPSEKSPGATTFVQEESFTGLFAWVMREDGMIGMLGVGRTVRSFFERFNADLKKAAEAEREDCI